NECTQHFSERVHQLLIYPEHAFELGKQAKAYALDKWTAKLQAERMISFYTQFIVVSKPSIAGYSQLQTEILKNQASH
ncbi:glycosyltransferase, partial [Methylotenera sp.]|nr:hypothetical protein [Methylotenera sp.]